MKTRLLGNAGRELCQNNGNMEVKKDQLLDIAFLRCIATFSLVVWHSYCTYICWGVAETPLNSFYSNLFTRLIPDANMPLFTILAGYLFYYLFREKGKYQEFMPYLLNKVNRLLIPFLVLGSIINLCEYGKDIKDILYGLPNHLWYCLMLFYIYISFWVIERFLGTKINLLFALISVTIVTYLGTGALSFRVPGGIFLPIYYYGYFFIGYIFRKYQDKLSERKAYLLIFAVLLYLSCCILNVNRLIVVISVTYFISLYYLANTQLVKSIIGGGKISNITSVFSKYSFGIYVFHQWILWNITREPHCLSIVKPLLETYYVSAPIILVILVFTVSWMLTHYSLKTKVGQYLLL